MLKIFTIYWNTWILKQHVVGCDAKNLRKKKLINARHYVKIVLVLTTF